MKIAKVTFQNNDVITTPINGTEQEIKKYYLIGKVFNIGVAVDNLQPVKKCEVIPETELQSRAAGLLANYDAGKVRQMLFQEKKARTTIDDIDHVLNYLNPIPA